MQAFIFLFGPKCIYYSPLSLSMTHWPHVLSTSSSSSTYGPSSPSFFLLYDSWIYQHVTGTLDYKIVPTSRPVTRRDLYSTFVRPSSPSLQGKFGLPISSHARLPVGSPVTSSRRVHVSPVPTPMPRQSPAPAPRQLLLSCGHERLLPGCIGAPCLLAAGLAASPRLEYSPLCHDPRQESDDNREEFGR
jgi:hypothetical protein